jgi:hypothetical protein
MSTDSIFKIRDQIAFALDGDAHEYWVGMSEQDKIDMAVEVQRGNATIDNCVETIKEWMEDCPPAE